jgi:hypothetical protein
MFPYQHLYPYINEGQDFLMSTIQVLVYKQRPDLFEKLGYDNPEAYLEPFLFTYFTSPHGKIPLDQLVFGYIGESSRPDKIEICTNKEGIAYLPKVGSFSTSKIDAFLTLFWDRTSKTYSLDHEGKAIDFVYHPPLYLADGGFEIINHHHPFFSDYFLEWDNEIKDFKDFKAQVEIRQITDHHLGNVEQALQYISKSVPYQFESFGLTTRRIVIFNNPQVRSFVVRNMHGIAFITAKKEFTDIYFVEELIHQCGHNVFNAITANLSRFFQIDPETPLKQYSKNPYEFKSIYSALHGLYTVAARLDGFDSCLDSVELVPEKQHELMGRFADLRRRFRNGLEKIMLHEVFTQEGGSIYTWLDRFSDAVFAKRSYLLGKFDYSNQSGTGFNYSEFVQANPVPKELVS